ncbi:hypothetical protein T492DRAFT_873167 [Pavlovales sp. CCMP2436]|nr:hypothetical protein T492DRAFT_873167 [Pavlovales sp. CCMP2436]
MLHRSQLDPSLSLSSLSLSSISLLPKGLRPRPSFADAMRALLLLADEMQAENKGGAKGGRGDGWQAGSVPEGAAGGTMSLTGLAGGGESQGGLLSRTLIALGLASPVPAALSVSAPVQVRHTGHVGLSADGHFEVGLEPEMRHLLGQVTTRPKEGKEGGSPHLPAGQAKGGVSSLAMGTLHTPQQTQQQQQQTPGSTANPTPASALSCARSPFSAIASAAASSPRTPASASRLGPFSQDELKVILIILIQP